MISEKAKRRIYAALLAATAFSLPLSEWLLSFSIILLSLFWILGGGLSRIPFLIKTRRYVIIFLTSCLVYAVWMAGSDNPPEGLQDLRLKLPLLILPLTIGFTEQINRRELILVLNLFIAGVVLSSSAGAVTDPRMYFSGNANSSELSPFISHIRLSIMSVFAVACSLWCFRQEWHSRLWQGFYIIASAWLVFFLFRLASFTGVLLFFVMAVITIYHAMARKGSFAFLKAAVIISVPAVVIALVAVKEVKEFYKISPAYPFPLSLYTENGNPYRHDTTRHDRENGNRVWLYISEDELEKEWEVRSRMPFDSLDSKGQVLKYTLIRYMTSAGLKKDSAGVSMLSENDIASIESGLTNCLFTRWGRWKTRMYELIWQIDYYRNDGNPSGHSVTQRIEFFKTGWKIFSANPLLGIGTGDIGPGFKEQYEKDNSMLDSSHRLVAHNQYLTFLVSFGIAGFLIIMAAFLVPFISAGSCSRYLPLVFFTIVMLSMLWEDTLETHTGVSFFAFFYTIFVFGTGKFIRDEQEK